MHLSKISLALRQWGAGAGFSPLDLFSSGEQGAWYDPSDINNYMGPELIVNGTFDSNTDGWTPIDATASVVGGKCVVTNTSNTWGLVTTELQVTVGDTYALSIYFDTTSGYDAAVGIPGLIEDYISAGQTITYSATVVADTNPLALIIGNADEVVGHNISFDNVSIRRIGEATMFQDAAGTTPVTADGQPVGLILDKSKGLALGPELAPDWDLLGGGAGWFVDPEFTIANGVAVGVVSVKSNNKYLYPEIINTEIGKVYEATFVVTEVTGRFHIFVWDGTTDINFKLDITDPGSYSLIFRANSTSGYYPYIDLLEPARVVVESISVKELAGNHASQATAASRPLYKTDGTYHWLQFDGVDDALETASINFTSTDKMSVFSGVRKISDAATGVYFETSGDASVNAGAVRLSSPSTAAAATYGFTFRGTTSTSQGSASTFSAPITNVLTTTFDGSQSGLANQVKARVNGSLQVLSVGSNGDTVGSMGNYVTYIGTRNGAWPLNGRIYSLIVLGRLATTQEITDTETWVADKTGVVLP